MILAPLTLSLVLFASAHADEGWGARQLTQGSPAARTELQVQVLDAAGDPLPGVDLAVLDTDGFPIARLRSDAEGRVQLAIPPGEAPTELEIQLVHVDHAPLEVSETLAPHEVLEVVYRLRPPVVAAEVTVYADRQREEVSRQVFTAEELSLVPGAFGDPVRALESLPGVARTQGFDGGLVIRGAEGLNTGFYVDDLPVPYLFHTLVGKSIVNPAFVDDIEFYAGGMPSRFGEVTQGAVNVRTDVDQAVGTESLLDINFLDAGYAVETGRDGWQLKAGGRYSWVGGLIAGYTGARALTQGGKFKEFPFLYPRYWDLHAVGERALSADQRLTLELLGSRDTMRLRPAWSDEDGDGILDEPTYFEGQDLSLDPTRLVDSGFLRLRLRYRATTGSHSEDSWIAVGPQQQQNLIGDQLLVSDGLWNGRVKGFTTVARREDRWTLSPKLKALAGGRLTVTRGTAEDFTQLYADESVPTIAETQDTQLSLSTFGELQLGPCTGAPSPAATQDACDRWLVAPGVRLSAYSFNDSRYLSPEPRLTLRRRASEDLVLKGFVGRFSQMPPLDRYADGLGNPELELITAWQGTAGAEWSRGAWTVDSSLYASHMRNLVVRDVELVIADLGGIAVGEPTQVYRAATGRAYGLETLVRVRPSGPWWGWMALTLGRADRLSADGLRSPSDFDQPVSFTLLGAWQAPKAWTLSSRLRLTSGQPYTPIEGVYDPYGDFWRDLVGEPNSARFPLFRQLDLRVEKEWARERVVWSAYLDIYNLTWARNPYVADYNFDRTELLSTIHIPLLPTLGATARF